jgi:hypothetical protein
MNMTIMVFIIFYFFHARGMLRPLTSKMNLFLTTRKRLILKTCFYAILGKMAPLQKHHPCRWIGWIFPKWSRAQKERENGYESGLSDAVKKHMQAFARVSADSKTSDVILQIRRSGFWRTLVLKEGYDRSEQRIFNFKGFLKSRRKRMARALLYIGHISTRR